MRKTETNKHKTQIKNEKTTKKQTVKQTHRLGKETKKGRYKMTEYRLFYRHKRDRKRKV